MQVRILPLSLIRNKVDENERGNMNLQPKPKRGAEFYHTELNQTVWLERIISNSIYFVRTSETPTSADEYIRVDVKLLKPAKNGFNSSLVAKPKVLTEKQKTDKQIMNEFFIKVALTMPYNCQNCNKPLYAFTQSTRRCVSAHILPKAEFESVKVDSNNIMFLGWINLGVCSCHDDWDRKGAENRRTMAVYQLALERFEIMKHKLTPHELNKAYTYLNIDLK